MGKTKRCFLCLKKGVLKDRILCADCLEYISQGPVVFCRTCGNMWYPTYEVKAILEHDLNREIDKPGMVIEVIWCGACLGKILKAVPATDEINIQLCDLSSQLDE